MSGPWGNNNNQQGPQQPYGPYQSPSAYQYFGYPPTTQPGTTQPATTQAQPAWTSAATTSPGYHTVQPQTTIPTWLDSVPSYAAYAPPNGYTNGYTTTQSQTQTHTQAASNQAPPAYSYRPTVGIQSLGRGDGYYYDNQTGVYRDRATGQQMVNGNTAPLYAPQPVRFGSFTPMVNPGGSWVQSPSWDSWGSRTVTNPTTQAPTSAALQTVAQSTTAQAPLTNGANRHRHATFQIGPDDSEEE